MKQLLPISIKVSSKLIGFDFVKVQPMTPTPLIINYDITYKYDSTKWLLEQRTKKIEKIRERINSKL
jgi:hypothetical protein